MKRLSAGQAYHRPRAAFVSFAIVAVAAALVSWMPPVAVRSSLADTGQAGSNSELQRVKGSVDVRLPGNVSRSVGSSLELPNEADAYAGCNSLGKLQFEDGSSILIGENSAIHVVSKGTEYLSIDRANIAFAIRGSNRLYEIVTPDAALTLHEGSGFIASGLKGTEIIALGGSPGDYSIRSGGAWYALKPGNSFVDVMQASPAGAGSDMHPSIMANAFVNNPVIYQFNNGTNPLDSAATTPPNDPTDSHNVSALCHPIASAGGGMGVLGWLLGVVGVVAAAAGLGHGGSSSSNSATQPPTITPTETPSPTGTASATPAPTPTPAPSSSPTSTPTPQPSVTPTPTLTPTPLPTASPTPTPTPTPCPTGTKHCD